MKEQNHISKDRNKKTPSLQHWHIFSNSVTTVITTLFSKKQKILISNEVNSVHWKTSAHLWHCLIFQSSQEFLPEPASKLLHSFTYFKEKISVYTNYLTIIVSIPHFSRADFMQLKRLLEKKMSCSPEHRMPSHCLPHRNSESSKLTLLTLPASSSHLCEPSRQKRSQTRSARKILWDWGLIPPCFLCSVQFIPHRDSLTQGKHLFSLFSVMFYYPDNRAHIHLFSKKFHA